MMTEHSRVRASIVRIRIFTGAALVVFAATLPWVRPSPGFVLYAVVLTVVIILVTWRLTGRWYLFWWIVLPSATMPGATRRFYDDPSLLSVTEIHILALLAVVYGTALLLFQVPRRRSDLLVPPPSES